MRAESLEQVFLARKGSGFELMLVLESVSGSRERVKLPTAAAEEGAAINFLLAYLRQNGYGLAPRLRVRRDRGGTLSDAPELVARITGALGRPPQDR